MARSAPLLALLSVCAISFTTRARADTLIIKNAGDHPRYSFEAEPHLLLGLIDPPGPADGTGLGLGFRGTFVLVEDGFVSTINNSVGIGFGADWVRYGGGRQVCVTDAGPSRVTVCTNSASVSEVWLPVVMQWNFFLSRQWSVFGEPGLALRYQSVPGAHNLSVDPQFYAGGRFHFSDQTTLTLRLGYPTFSVGVSFL
jgi:hypothetical protein